MLTVKRITNTPVTSNCFVIFDNTDRSECIIVDPGTKNNEELLAFISSRGLIPKYIILTHEHFDHCWGVNALVERYHVPILCSALCADAIRDIKRNCSVFYDFYERFSITSDTISIESIGDEFQFAGGKICFFKTPGHTDASICFVAGGFLFTGDTVIKDEKTVTKLPTGSIKRLKESIAVINILKSEGQTVCPGHGEGFALDEYELSKCLEGNKNEKHCDI